MLLTENTRLRRLHTEESKRALWCLYVLDKSFAASYGRRALMAPLEIECPTTCDDEGINIVSHFNAMIKLYGIVGDVVDMFYAVNGSTNVDDLNEKLDSWRNNYISTTQLPSQFECLKVIGYNVVKIFINKKSLTSTSHNLEICVEAAKTILSTLHYMHCESELVVTYTDALLNWSVSMYFFGKQEVNHIHMVGYFCNWYRDVKSLSCLHRYEQHKRYTTSTTASRNWNESAQSEEQK